MNIQSPTEGQAAAKLPPLANWQERGGFAQNNRFQHFLQGAVSEEPASGAGGSSLAQITEMKQKLMQLASLLSPQLEERVEEGTEETNLHVNAARTHPEELIIEMARLLSQWGLADEGDLLQRLLGTTEMGDNLINFPQSDLEIETDSLQNLIQTWIESMDVSLQTEQQAAHMLALLRNLEQIQLQMAYAGGYQGASSPEELAGGTISVSQAANNLTGQMAGQMTAFTKNQAYSFAAANQKNGTTPPPQQGNASQLLNGLLQQLNAQLPIHAASRERQATSLHELKMSTFIPISLMGSVEGGATGQSVESPLQQHMPIQTGTMVQPGASQTASPNGTMQTVIEELQSLYRNHWQALRQGDSVQSIRIQLHPAHLGQVDIRVSSRDGLVTAELITTNKMAQTLMEMQINHLRTSLVQQGIQVDKIEVTQQSQSSNQLFQEQQAKSGQHPFQQEARKGTAEPNQSFGVEEEDQPEQSRIVPSDSQIDYAV